MTTNTTEAALPLVAVAQRTQTIRTQLTGILSGSDRPELVQLAESTPAAEAADTVCLVFVGQYNAGKSTLITALTGMDVPIGSDVTTNTATTYPWADHLLVDTPGVRAGSSIGHDIATDRALDVADAVIFVLTSEGLDDTTADYLLGLLARLRSAGQLIVVVNKAHSEDSDRDEILADIRKTYDGIGSTVPLVCTEARDWVNADFYPLPEARRARSAVRELAEVIDETTRRRGAQLRLATPLRELSRHIRRAIEEGAGTSYRGSLDALDAVAEEVETRRVALLDATHHVSAQIRNDLAAELIALTPMHEGEDIDTAISKAQTTFVDTLNARAEQVIEEASTALATRDAPELTDQGAEGPISSTWPQIRSHLVNGLNVVSRSFQGANARPGGLGHRIVTQGWHAVGGKFRPWGARKAAESIGKVAKFGGVALVVGEGAVGVWMDYRSQRRAAQDAEDIRAWAAAARTIASETVGSWSSAAELAAHAMCDEDIRMIGRQRVTLLARMTEASDTVRKLVGLDDEILNLIATLSNGT